MESIIVCDASARLGVTHERFVAMAFHYFEDRKSKKYIMEVFLDFYHTGKIHPTLSDFTLEVLSGRVTR